MSINRRGLLAAGIGLGAVAGLTACGVGGQQQVAQSGGGELRMTWWGGDSEGKALNAALDAYQEQASVTVKRESLPWDGYWDKLATQTAGRNAPDVVMQAGSQIPDYAGRQALTDLNGVDGLDPTVVDEGLQTFGAVEDKLFGVVAAANAMSLVTNPSLVEKAKVSVPEGEYDWQELGELANRVHQELGDDVWGMGDAGGDLISLILRVRAGGKEFYTDDGKINIAPDELTAWLEMWHKLRESGGAPPPDVTSEGQGDMANSPFVRQRTAFAFGWTQDYVSMASLMDQPITIGLPPNSQANPGLWMNAASLWSISATSANVAGAGALINHLLTDDAAITTIGLALGTPPTQQARDLLTGNMDETQQAATDYMNRVAEQSKPLNRLWPKGFAELRSLLQEQNEAIAFKKMSIDDAVTAFFAKAEQDA
ncbi:ABC transporter substrate-binding protein [Propionibacteriaceae bacterium Y1700]|uniref:ABC transporter substrate-binding protein n=1 Tax=Microlunatus sp. Y1700 TaxID=3418487 RepID=UPI003DA761E0